MFEKYQQKRRPDVNPDGVRELVKLVEPAGIHLGHQGLDPPGDSP